MPTPIFTFWHAALSDVMYRDSFVNLELLHTINAPKRDFFRIVRAVVNRWLIEAEEVYAEYGYWSDEEVMEKTAVPEKVDWGYFSNNETPIPFIKSLHAGLWSKDYERSPSEAEDAILAQIYAHCGVYSNCQIQSLLFDVKPYTYGTWEYVKYNAV